MWNILWMRTHSGDDTSSFRQKSPESNRFGGEATPGESIGVDPELETSRLDGNLCVLRDKIADFLTQILSSDDGPDGTSLLERLTPYAMVAGSAAFGLAYARRHRNRQRLLAGEIGMSDDDPSWDRRPDLVFLPMVPHP